MLALLVLEIVLVLVLGVRDSASTSTNVVMEVILLHFCVSVVYLFLTKKLLLDQLMNKHYTCSILFDTK